MGRGLLVQLPKRLRVVLASVAAIATALNHLVRSRDDGPRVVLAPGDRAPDFTLPASDGHTYGLSEFAGRQAVVLAWFPKAFTGGCTAQCESMGFGAGRLRRLGAACFAISVDTPATNRSFASSFGLDVPILSDPEKHVARAYGVLGASGFPSRWTFYIGLDGRIVAIDKNVRVRSHGADIEQALSELRLSRQA